MLSSSLCLDIYHFCTIWPSCLIIVYLDPSLFPLTDQFPKIQKTSRNSMGGGRFGVTTRAERWKKIILYWVEIVQSPEIFQVSKSQIHLHSLNVSISLLIPSKAAVSSLLNYALCKEVFSFVSVESVYWVFIGCSLVQVFWERLKRFTSSIPCNNLIYSDWQKL